MADFIGKELIRRTIIASLIGVTALFFTLYALIPIENSRTRYEDLPHIAEEIGTIINHSTDTVILGKYYGNEITYHGWIMGAFWPHTYDFAWVERGGGTVLRGEELFNARYAPRNPDFFVIIDLEEVERQRELKEFLDRDFEVLAESESYIIYDMRQSVSGN